MSIRFVDVASRPEQTALYTAVDRKAITGRLSAEVHASSKTDLIVLDFAGLAYVKHALLTALIQSLLSAIRAPAWFALMSDGTSKQHSNLVQPS